MQSEAMNDYIAAVGKIGDLQLVSRFQGKYQAHACLTG